MASILSNLKEMFQSDDDPEQFKDDFIYWWDDVAQQQLGRVEKKSLGERFEENRAFILHSLIFFSILPLLIYVGFQEPYFALIFGLLSLGLISISYIQIGNNFVHPNRVIMSNVELIGKNDLTGNDELLYSKEDYESVMKFDKFRDQLVKLLSNLNDKSISIYNEMEGIQSKNLGVYRNVDQINLSIDNTVASTANYQETKGYLSQISRSVDDFIANFDNTLDSISEVTGVLKSIGKQTTMLALNAGIEAAKAGTQGKGFEVVASNLRRLADHAIESSNRIDNMTDDINERAKSAIETITFGMSALQDLTDTNHDTIVRLNDDLFSSIKELDDLGRELSQITQNVEGQLDGIKEFKF